MTQEPCVRDSPDQACRPCSRRGLSRQQCGPSTFGLEAESKLARQRGEHTLDTQNDVRTNDSALGTGSTAQHIPPAVSFAVTTELAAPFGFRVQTTPSYNPEIWHTAIAFDVTASEAEFEQRLQAFLAENCLFASPATQAAACDLIRRARTEHSQGSILWETWLIVAIRQFGLF